LGYRPRLELLRKQRPLNLAHVDRAERPTGGCPPGRLEVVDSHLPGEVVAGPGRHGQEGDARVEQDLGGATQGAVAAGDAHEVRTVGQRRRYLLRHLRRLTGHDELPRKDEL
jgi:hypothetical protein